MRAAPGIVHGNFDDVDAKQRRPVVAGRFVDAAFHLFLLADSRSTGVVDDDAVVVGRDDGMGVGTAAGLDRAYLYRPGQIADVEDADPAEPLVADVSGDALEPAVEPAAGLLHRHDQQVADDRDVTLPTRAHNGADLLRQAPFVQPIDVEPVVTAGKHYVVPEGHVGVAEIQQRRALPLVAVLVVLAAAVGLARVAVLIVVAAIGTLAVAGAVPVLRILFFARLVVVFIPRAFRRQLGRVPGVEEAGAVWASRPRVPCSSTPGRRRRTRPQDRRAGRRKA